MVKQHLKLRLRLGVARHDDSAAIGSRQMHVDHLNGAELLQNRSRGQPRRQITQSAPQGYLHGVGDEGHKDVRLDAKHLLVVDRTQGQVSLAN